MTSFIEFREAVNKSFNKLSKSGNLFQSGVEKDAIWDTYLASFPQGTNNLFRERTEHDCVCCKQFIRNIGRVLGEKDGKIVSVFDDLPVTGHYKVVADSLAELNKQSKIFGIYLHDQQTVGQRETYETLDDGSVHTWNHFHQVLPDTAYSLKGDIAERKGKTATNCKVLKRSITTLSEDAVNIVSELIDQNSIHRGSEFAPIVNSLKLLQKQYASATDKDLFLWNKTIEYMSNNYDCNIRGSAIGTLLVDLTDDVELEVAVKKYEDKVSGTNYKRTSALVTPRMKEEAKKKAKELSIEPSLLRRMANKSDVSIHDVLFADNSVKPFMEDSIFDCVPTKATTVKNMDKVEEVTAEHFVTKILPSAESIELLLENKHENNLMTLVAPVNAAAPCIMKWGNNFSWSYNGEVAESVIKQRVKAQGGVVDAPLRVSLSWQNRDDLDLHLVEAGGGHVYFANKQGKTGSRLDVDMRGESLHQVENIYWNDLSNLRRGVYKVYVENFSSNARRSNEDNVEGFSVEVENNGEITTVAYEANLRSGRSVDVLSIKVDSSGSISVVPELESVSSFVPKEVWGISTGQFHKVNMVMKSPNHWENSTHKGSEQLFFILDGCVNPDDVRGVYNEFLIDELQPHRKVFEVLASQLKAEYSEDQLSGVGFSSTLRNEVTLRVKGSFNRVIKVKF